MNEKVVFSGDMRLKKTIDGQPNAIYEKTINEHDKLIHRDYEDQHPIEAITGLAEELADIEEQLASVTIEEVDPTVPAWAKQPTKPTYTASEVGALPADTAIPEKLSDLTDDVRYLTAETDPSVPAWAKSPTKPTYTAAEVGALPNDTEIPVVPTDVSAFENDAGYLTSYTETDPTVPNWAKQASKPTYTASEVGALPSTYTPPVTSVNGRTGAVTITIPTVPTAVSAFTNDAGYITLADLPIYDGSVT